MDGPSDRTEVFQVTGDFTGFITRHVMTYGVYMGKRPLTIQCIVVNPAYWLVFVSSATPKRVMAQQRMSPHRIDVILMFELKRVSLSTNTAITLLNHGNARASPLKGRFELAGLRSSIRCVTVRQADLLEVTDMMIEAIALTIPARIPLRQQWDIFTETMKLLSDWLTAAGLV